MIFSSAQTKNQIHTSLHANFKLRHV